MSLITQCPACNTLFKVVADQLKISQGWVRCGQCKEVFDAQAHLNLLPVLAETEPMPQPSSESEVSIAPSESQWAVSAPPPDMLGATPSSYGPVNLPFGSRPEFAASDWANSVNPPKPSQPADRTEELDNQELQADPAEALLPQASLAAQPAVTPGFVRQAQQAQRWRSPWMRFALGFFAFLLIALGTIQVAIHERDRIVATYPRTQGVMVQLCQRAGCSVGPLKQIEAIVVDASSFNKMRSDSKNDLYKVTLNLKNNGPMTVALPHIELSLNDSQDQTIVRRVLNPADIGALQLVLQARGEFNGSAVVQIDTAQLSGARVAGYRIWAFYPS
jgi:predicted Zn finger-like uncharacterized protein